MTVPRLAALLLALAAPAAAQIVVPVRTIAPQTVIGPGDLTVSDADIPGAVTDAAQAIGLEARVALYPNRPIRPQDLGLPAVIERNAIVPLVYQVGNLLITSEGRALDRAGPGEIVRVMNTQSRATVTARVGADGTAYVSD